MCGEKMTDEEPKQMTYKIFYQNEEVMILVRDRSGDEEEGTTLTLCRFALRRCNVGLTRSRSGLSIGITIAPNAATVCFRFTWTVQDRNSRRYVVCLRLVIGRLPHDHD